MPHSGVLAHKHTWTKGIKCGLPRFYAVQRLQQSPDDFPVTAGTCLVRRIEMRVFGLLRRNSQSNFFFHLRVPNRENKVCVWSDFATCAPVVEIEIMLFSFEIIKLFSLCKEKPLRSRSMVLKTCECVGVEIQPSPLVFQLFLPSLLRLDASFL